MKSLIAFDLDGTLAASKQPLDDEMARQLADLLIVRSVAIISGGDWPQFERQVVSRLPAGAALGRLYILPTTGTKLYRWRAGGWALAYAEDFDADTRAKIRAALAAALESEDLPPSRTWGDRIEDRGSQITFSGLGQDAPLEAKEQWDPNRAKRTKLQAELRKRLPDLSINIGGSTSVDITRPGVDKGYGLRKLAQYANIPISEMLFFGDALFPGGNDYPAQAIGVAAIRVRDPQECARLVAAIVALLT
jgi:phosphomannomutase